MFNNCWVAGGGECLGYACYGGIPMTMTSYTKRCRRSRRVCWCKFGWNPTSSFSVICDLVSLSLILRQGVILVFACLSIYSLTRGPELFACLSIYENAETLSQCLEESTTPTTDPPTATECDTDAAATAGMGTAARMTRERAGVTSTRGVREINEDFQRWVFP